MLDWTDLRYFLEVSRAGTLAGAGAALRVDASTVGRRLAALEAALGSRLFDRSPQGYRATPAGLALRERAERVEAEVLALERTASGGDRALSGAVRLATTEGLAVDLLGPHLGELRRRYPALQLRVHTGNRELNLARREADLALRLNAPKQPDLLGLSAGHLTFGLYAHERYLLQAGPVDAEAGLAGHQLVTYDEELAKLPECEWLTSRAAGAEVALRANSVLVLASAVEAGLGLGVLPRWLAERRPGLHRLVGPERLPSREVWVVLHRDLRKTARVRAVAEYVREVISRGLLGQ